MYGTQNKFSLPNSISRTPAVAPPVPTPIPTPIPTSIPTSIQTQRNPWDSYNGSLYGLGGGKGAVQPKSIQDYIANISNATNQSQASIPQLSFNRAPSGQSQGGQVNNPFSIYQGPRPVDYNQLAQILSGNQGMPGSYFSGFPMNPRYQRYLGK